MFWYPKDNPSKKGDTLLILEAMKMENALKAPHDGISKKSIHQQRNSSRKKSAAD
ncbi:MAG: hypothetical protein KatS3mg028_0248 [Bacteroidia bacterium]|nr:MAG: hypothetical protein KatS3mg028_0248 [Bacteroidia bacterium]